MSRPVTFTIEINLEGEAYVRLPEGRGQQRDANAIAPLTIQIAEAIGPVKERHIGDHEHHEHGHRSHDQHDHHHA